MATLASPISSRPRRWIIPMRSMACGADLPHRLDGQRNVALVLQIPGLASARLVPGDPFEGHHRTVRATRQARYQSPYVDGDARDSEIVAHFVLIFRLQPGASTYRR